MNNRIFNVNGEGDKNLLSALKLCFNQWGSNTTADSWTVDKGKGLILEWHTTKTGNVLPCSMNAEEVLPFVSKWLKGDDAKSIPCIDWDANADHDGSNSLGWRVYVEEWGHVENNEYAICAIKPAYMWYGK